MSMRKFWAMLILLLSASAIAQAEVIVTISGADDTKDSYVSNMYPDTNNGSLNYMAVGGTYSNRNSSIIQFDLSDIRSLYPNYRVTNTELSVYQREPGGNTATYNVDLRTLNSSWAESQVTYNSSSTGVRWSGNGGAGNIMSTDGEGDFINFSEASLGTIQMQSLHAGWYTWNTTDLSDYYNGVLQETVTDNGFILYTADELGTLNAVVMLSSSEATNQTYAPKLTLTLSEVPEPATVALLLVGGCPMLMYRRLKKNRG